jgi:hypothetical protein
VQEKAEELAQVERRQAGKPIRLTREFDVPGTIDNVDCLAAMVAGMDAPTVVDVSNSRDHVPSHVPFGATLLALELSGHARGMRGLDVLRRSIDRAPPLP